MKKEVDCTPSKIENTCKQVLYEVYNTYCTTRTYSTQNKGPTVALVFSNSISISLQMICVQ